MSEVGSIVEELPKPVRRSIEIIQLAGSLIGAIASIFGFFSFMARLFWWHDLWILIETWAQSFPHELMVAVQWLGFAVHRIVVAYRETIYPLVYAFTHFLPFRIPPWAIDAFFITVFSLIAAWRIRTHGSFMFGEGFRFWRLYGIYIPFWLIAQIGSGIISIVDHLISLVTFRRVRIFDPIYDALPDGIDDFVFGALAVSAVLLFFLGIDQAYVALRPQLDALYLAG
jgi:hypothetical protein